MRTEFLSRASFWLFSLMLFALPFGRKIAVPILVLWIISTFVSYLLLKDFSLLRFRTFLVLPVIFFLLHLPGLLLSANHNEALLNLQLKLSLFFIPVLYPYHRKTFIEGKTFFIKAAVFGIVAASLVCVVYAAYNSIAFIDGKPVFDFIRPDGWSHYFSGSFFSLFIHASYFAFYILAAIISLWHLKNSFFKNRWLSISFSLVLLLFLIAILGFLGSRAGLLGLIFILGLLLIYLAFTKKKLRFLLLLVIPAIIVMVFFIMKNYRYQNTITSIEILLKEGIPSEEKTGDTAIRFWIWKSALELIMNHPLTGVGNGDIRDELVKIYEREGMSLSATERHNAHNQFLESWTGIGIPGLLSLLAMLALPLWAGIKNSDWLLAGFISLCTIAFMFESMLETIAGVSFFSVFYTLLVSRHIQLKSQNKQLQAE